MRKDIQQLINETNNKSFSKISDAKLFANELVAQRNKEKSFREKVSKGVSNHFGTIENRFESKLVKLSNGCIEYPNRWIYDGKKAYQPKQYAAIFYNLGFTKELVVQKCKNTKCVNPKHLIEMTREEQCLIMLKKLKK